MQGMRNSGCKPSSSQLLTHHAGCDRGRVSRRLKPALLDLTVSSLRQAWLLGRLHRTSPVPFRGSYFTADSIIDSYAPTTHRLPVQPMGLRSIVLLSSVPPMRFVTHPCAPSLMKNSQKPLKPKQFGERLRCGRQVARQLYGGEKWAPKPNGTKLSHIHLSQQAVT
jgi:hypothetical protein